MSIDIIFHQFPFFRRILNWKLIFLFFLLFFLLFSSEKQKTDVTNELVEEIQIKTKEFLQPNPTARAKMAAVKGISKLSGQAKSNTYPQPEGLLSDCMLMYGKKLGENSIFGMFKWKSEIKKKPHLIEMITVTVVTMV